MNKTGGDSKTNQGMFCCISKHIEQAEEEDVWYSNRAQTLNIQYKLK